MRTSETGKRRLMFRVALDGKPRHFLAGRGHRSAAIVTTGEALEAREAPSKKSDFLIIAGHGGHFLGVCGVANFACGMKDGSPGSFSDRAAAAGRQAHDARPTNKASGTRQTRSCRWPYGKSITAFIPPPRRMAADPAAGHQARPARHIRLDARGINPAPGKPMTINPAAAPADCLMIGISASGSAPNRRFQRRQS